MPEVVGSDGIGRESAHSMLEIEFNELRKAWQSFQDALPVKDRLVIDKPQQGAADVIQELRHAIHVWSSPPARFRFRASLNLADKCIASIKSHDVLMHELPSPKDHGSLFCSVVRSIIYVSILQSHPPSPSLLGLPH